MQITATPLKDLLVVKPEPFTDERGWFARIYDNEVFKNAGMPLEWMQVNHSFTKAKGAIRGMHFQHPPHEEIKMVKCISGSIWDVAVDVRSESPTYLQHYGIELSAANNLMLIIPQGFAHGFQALEDDCAMIYFHSERYTPGSEGGLRFNDPLLNINWPLPVSIISDRDKNHQLLKTEK